MARSPFRFGILSTALIGREQLIPAIGRAENAVVTAIASRSASKAEALAGRIGAPHAFGSYEALLASDEIDGVYIPLPTAQHVEWTRKALEAGKHVLCEKPIALQAAEIDALIAARDASGKLVSEAFMITYHPQWAKVRELIGGEPGSDGAIGELRTVDAAFSYCNRDESNLRNRPELGGGVLPDIGVYPVVSARFATGREPVRVQATVEYDPNFGTDRYASVRVDFGGFEMLFYVGTQLAARQTIAFHGDEGFVEVAAPWNSNLYEGDEVRLHDRDHAGARIFRYTGVDQYALQVEAFVRAALETDGGEENETARSAVFSLEDSVRNQRVIDAIYAAGRSGNWEEIPGDRPGTGEGP